MRCEDIEENPTVKAQHSLAVVVEEDKAQSQPAILCVANAFLTTEGFTHSLPTCTKEREKNPQWGRMSASFNKEIETRRFGCKASVSSIRHQPRVACRWRDWCRS